MGLPRAQEVWGASSRFGGRRGERAEWLVVQRLISQTSGLRIHLTHSISALLFYIIEFGGQLFDKGVLHQQTEAQKPVMSNISLR